MPHLGHEALIPLRMVSGDSSCQCGEPMLTTHMPVVPLGSSGPAGAMPAVLVEPSVYDLAQHRVGLHT